MGERSVFVFVLINVLTQSVSYSFPREAWEQDYNPFFSKEETKPAIAGWGKKILQ